MISKKILSFPFNFITRKKLFSELQKLKTRKSIQGSNIPVKNIHIITNFIYNCFDNSLFSSYFQSNLKKY